MELTYYQKSKKWKFQDVLYLSILERDCMQIVTSNKKLHSGCHTSHARARMWEIFTPKKKFLYCKSPHSVNFTSMLWNKIQQYREKVEKWRGWSSTLSAICRHNHPSFLKYGNVIFLKCVSAKKSYPSCWYTQPLSLPQLCFSLVMLLVSWPGRQYDEISWEMIPVCSSDYFSNSHLILPTKHQQGARERPCGSWSHGGRKGEDEEKKGKDGEGRKKNTETNTKHIGGERQLFQFWEMRRARWSVLYDQRVWLVICFPFHKTI